LLYSNNPHSWTSVDTQLWGGLAGNCSLIPSGVWLLLDDHRVQNKFQCPLGIISKYTWSAFPRGKIIDPSANH
jgi:hypothetical protein